MACGILVPQPGIRPVPPAMKVWSPNHGTTREFLIISILDKRKLRLEEVKELGYVLTAQEGCNLNSNPGSSDTSPDSKS